jgi:formate--tetrahydrofolate ligase
MPLWEKLNAIATRIYGAKEVTADAKVRAQMASFQKDYGSFPVCVAKTQMSFSDDPSLLGAPSGHSLHISDVRVSNGAGFIVAICGNMMTMPGLPKAPAAQRIDIDANGNISGLF